MSNYLFLSLSLNCLYAGFKMMFQHKQQLWQRLLRPLCSQRSSAGLLLLTHKRESKIKEFLQLPNYQHLFFATLSHILTTCINILHNNKP